MNQQQQQQQQLSTSPASPVSFPRGALSAPSAAALNAAVSARAASSVRRKSSTDSLLLWYTGEICNSSTQKLLYSLEKALSAYLSMQYTNRSRSPIRSLSLAVVVLHCSLHGFNLLLYRSRLASLQSKTPISCSGARASYHTLTPLLYFPAGDQTLTP